MKITGKVVKEAVKKCEAMRRDTKVPVDISLSEFMKSQGHTMEAVYNDLGINPTVDTIQNIINMPDSSLRWLIPEIYRDAIRLGLRRAPIYPNLIAAEQSVSQTSVKMPAINMSDATPRKVGMGETITTGSVSFDEKQVSIYKYGRGFKIPYEIVQYVPLNLVSIFLQDFGVKMGMGLDNMAISTLLNGDQANGNDSISTIGIAVANDLTFRDLLKPWVRLGRLGKSANQMIAGEDMAVDILELLVNNRTLGNQRVNVNVKTPLPTNANVYVHGAVPANTVIILDPATTMVKLNAQPLLIESDRVIQNQIQEVYCSFTTGFATIFRDSRIALDQSIAFAGNGFPTWMDPTAQEQVEFE
jgi:hypothetical protein